MFRRGGKGGGDEGEGKREEGEKVGGRSGKRGSFFQHQKRLPLYAINDEEQQTTSSNATQDRRYRTLNSDA